MSLLTIDTVLATDGAPGVVTGICNESGRQAPQRLRADKQWQGYNRPQLSDGILLDWISDATSISESFCRGLEQGSVVQSSALSRTCGLLWANFIILWAIVGNMKIDADELQTNETDDRGRIYLGTEYANKRVTVAVVDVENDRPDEDELATAYREASESASDLADKWSGTSDEAWGRLDE